MRHLKRTLRSVIAAALTAIGIVGCVAPDMTPFVTMTDRYPITSSEQSRNRAAAQAIITAIAAADVPTIRQFVSPDQYWRHDSRLPGDRDALIAALTSAQRLNWRVRIVRTLVDGPYVLTHSEYRAANRVYAGFEVYRFDGKYAVESWKAMQLMPPPNPSGRTLLDGAVTVADRHLSQSNKILIGQVAEEILFKGNFSRIPDFISDPYIQHNPKVPDGIDGLMAEAAKRKQGALWAFDYQRPLLLLGEGNFGVTMMDIEYDGVPALHFDMFRVEDGKVREHWDLFELKPGSTE